MTLRPGFMAALIIAVHALDLLTFWMALHLFGVPIGQEKNPLMVGAYQRGGFLLVAATEVALVAFVLALLARLRSRPVWPIFLFFYVFGLIGAVANLHAISEVPL